LADQKAQGLLNTRLIVHGPDGAVIGFSEDVQFGANTDSLMENLPLPANGDYQIEVRSSPEGATSGTYTLMLQAGKIVTATATPTNQKPEPPTLTPTLTPIGEEGAAPTATPW